MTDYLREVEESMRAERWARLWKEHGKLIITLCVALVAGTAAQTTWLSWQTSKNQDVTTQLLEATRADDPAAKFTELSSTSGQPAAALAGLMAANTHLKNKEWDKAIALYKQTAENRAFPQISRDLARVQMIAVQLDHDPKIPMEELLAALRPIAESKDSAWKTRALILSATIKADRKNDYAAALADLARAESDTSLPLSVTNDIRSLKSVYSARMASPVKSKSPTETEGK